VSRPAVLPELLTLEEAAEALRVSSTTKHGRPRERRHIKETLDRLGLPYVQVGSQRAYETAAVSEWIARNRRTPVVVAAGGRVIGVVK